MACHLVNFTAHLKAAIFISVHITLKDAASKLCRLITLIFM